MLFRSDGRTLDDKRQEIEENDIPDIIERYQNLEKEEERKRTEQSFFCAERRDCRE